MCVTGKITSHREKPEIIATEPKQIVEQRRNTLNHDRRREPSFAYDDRAFLVSSKMSAG